MLKAYTLIVGLLLVLLGLVGLASSARLVPVIHTSPVTDLFHLAVGTLFLYLALWQSDPTFIRVMVAGMGVLFLSVMGVIIVVPLLWGDAPLADVLEIVGLVVGLLSVAAARYLPDS